MIKINLESVVERTTLTSCALRQQNLQMVIDPPPYEATDVIGTENKRSET